MFITILFVLENLFLLGIIGVWAFCKRRNAKGERRRLVSEHLKYYWEASPAAREIFTPVARECLAISLGLEVVSDEEGMFSHFRDPRHDTPEAVDWHGLEDLSDFQAWRALLIRKLNQQGISMCIFEEMLKIFLKDIKNPTIPEGVDPKNPYPH